MRPMLAEQLLGDSSCVTSLRVVCHTGSSEASSDLPPLLCSGRGGAVGGWPPREQDSHRRKQLLCQEAAAVGQDIITPRSIFSKQRARFQRGLDPEELLRVSPIIGAGDSSITRAENPSAAVSRRCSPLHPAALSGLESDRGRVRELRHPTSIPGRARAL